MLALVAQMNMLQLNCMKYDAAEAKKASYMVLLDKKDLICLVKFICASYHLHILVQTNDFFSYVFQTWLAVVCCQSNTTTPVTAVVCHCLQLPQSCDNEHLLHKRLITGRNTFTITNVTMLA